MLAPATLSARPLAWFALASVAGIVLADSVFAWVPAWLWLLPALSLVVLAAWRRKSGLLLGLIALVFAFKHAATLSPVLHSSLRHYLNQRGTPLDVIAEGHVIKPLRRDLPGTEPGQALFVAESVTAPYAGEKWTGAIPLRTFPGRTVLLEPGFWRIEGRLRLPAPPDNPGQFDERRHDLRHGLVAELKATELRLIKPDRWNLAAWLDDMAERSREWIKASLARSMGDDALAQTIVLATILGGAEAEARDLEDPFRVTGTLHIFAVSGLHVGIIGWIMWRLLKPLGLSRFWMTVLVSSLLFAYAFVTGLRPSTVRAAVMAVTLMSGELWQRRPDMLNSLGAAALLLVIDDTNQVFSIGFQLSFSVLTAIALLNRPLMQSSRPMTEQDEFLPEALLSSTQRLLRHFRRSLAATLAISTASWLGSLPFTIRHFHLATPVALIANAVLVPVAFLILFTTVLLLGSTLIHLSGLAAILGNANWAFARFALASAQGFALIPGGYFYLDLSLPRSRPPVELSVLRLRGGGAAQHLHTAAGDWLLDCGPTKDYNLLLRAFLRDRGQNRIAGLVLSHADFEHVGAAADVARDYRIGRIFISAAEKGTRSTGLRRLADMGIVPTPLAAGAELVVDGSKPLPVRASVLFPPEKYRASRADDRALVMRIDAGKIRILWCGDAGFSAEKFISEKQPTGAARCDVLIRNQHPGEAVLLPEFLDAARPRVIISSNNSFPDEQKLPQSIRDICASRGITLIDQAQTGAVALRIWPDRLEIRGFRKGSADLTLEAAQDRAP